MNIYADSLSELRYERGIVSFLLHAGATKSAGTYVSIPIADLSGMVRFLGAEMPKILEAHLNWEANRTKLDLSPDSVAEVLVPKLPLGPLLTSV